ncbi:MAG: pilus assembly PilX N-terminal domain-containing protein [Acidobacteriia bacterium]|nr:pilus assembly PilX N-terminal domain-containing protein [Terriglobia bacterium]
MKQDKISRGFRNLKHRLHSKGRDKNGVALITALIFLGVTMLLGLSIMLTTSSDVFISGTMRNSKTAFYAADAGISVMRTALVNEIKTRTPRNLVNGTDPVFPCPDATFDTAVLTAALGNAGNGNAQTVSSYSTYGDSPARYTIDTTSPGGQPRTSFSCTLREATAGPFPRFERYTFAYQITANGGVPGAAADLAQSTVIEKGTITYNAEVIQTDHPTDYWNLLFSFAGYGMFIDHYDPHNGSTLLHGTITGRVHTNGEWGFSTGNPNYVFTDQVSSVNQNACYYFNSCVDRNANSVTQNGQTVAPVFMSGFSRGVQSVSLPENSNSQSRAVIDGSGIDMAALTDPSRDPNSSVPAPPAPTAAELSANLRNANGTAFGGGNGVYAPIQIQSDDGRGHITYRTTGAGVYVNGNVTDMTLDARTPGLQIYTINQGGTVSTVTYNLTPGTAINGYPPLSTTLQSGGRSITSSGLPTNVNPVNPNRPASQQPAASISLYVNGAINSLHGPGPGLPGVQDSAAMTITATGNITITGDLDYHTRPVTTTQGQVAPGVPPNSPPGTLIPSNDNGQALGIYTSTGNIYIDVSGIQSRNIEIDASMATLSNGGNGGITVGGGVNASNITIVGGRIQNNIMVLGNSSTVRNVLFDRRYANSAYAPPFFPSTNAAAIRGTDHTFTYPVAADPNSLRAVATSYVVPSRLLTAANAGQ